MSDSLCGDFNRGFLVEKPENNDANVIKLLKERRRGRKKGRKKNITIPLPSSTPPEMENILISAVILSSGVY